MSAAEITVDFISTYTAGDGSALHGIHTFRHSPDTDILLTPADSSHAEFELRDVTIGVGFHWQRNEAQRFTGQLRIVADGGRLTAINIVGAEEYLRSVISSEMSATSSEELLKAHAVISRSWLMARVSETRHIADRTAWHDDCTDEMPDEIIRWYDSGDHSIFDVCADDHCQRYQGMTRVTTPTVDRAIEATRGQVLMDGGVLCDTRFSKCCGGVLEQFENCWEPVPHPYLTARRDSDRPDDYPDLSVECNAEEWILGSPSAFCNTDDAEILSQVLNDYDRETRQFYRWRVEYTREEIASILRERSGIDFGYIVDLVPVARGTSGRLYKLEIVGTRRTVTVGKELEIRRWLSRSHLYSSAFVVERIAPDADGIPQRFVLHGAGWGHGVGLCQIGAAVMSARGYDFTSILSHYYPGSSLIRLY